MFGFGDGNDAAQQVENTDDDNKGSLTHEVVAGAASFYAMRKFEESQREKGEAVDHGTAKELLAAFAGGEADKLIETKGLDALDAERAKSQAKQNASEMYDQQYGNYDSYDPNNSDQQSYF